MSELNKIKARIRALTSKTTQNGCTEQEALLAMEKVGELLTVYNLSLADVHLSEEKCIERSVPLGRSTIPRWAYIFTSIAKFTQTKAWTNRPNVHFFGFEADVELAVFLAHTVLQTLDAETARFHSTPTYRSSRRKRFATNSFKLGLVRRLSERLIPPPPKAFGKELVLAKTILVEKELNRQRPDLQLRTQRTKSALISRDAYSAGRAAADRVNIARNAVGNIAGYLT